MVFKVIPSLVRWDLALAIASVLRAGMCGKQMCQCAVDTICSAALPITYGYKQLKIFQLYGAGSNQILVRPKQFWNPDGKGAKKNYVTCASTTQRECRPIGVSRLFQILL